ncbi:hypothetical protein SAMN02910447_03500 [Ruminococcus sp. YE71]|uniref:DUF6076 domain-containing protein n=1 Tax=unclassified Ruminococcus TaxID=2608920 RepID=UPI0008896353|nr:MULTISPECIES: DUF6076 domain-containing protein [unclassified Ruminococcus]SDA31373.1 hypothetical protein SAMN02910446_03446 [Ruminococcus sp. YE78]SDA32257.1 hypothetical protein SAMN02910446_03566 [Ruminococcus sp. YE78]SFW51565.1 hypothetical protein SAMN02910447_03379 [Ruminococcus sp. YE71]SFW53100.1 hypothetical protein SAMN02910447_03500 [Ruminococcus sp. YE71]
MFSECVFWVKGDRIEVNGREFMLGELSASCLNITPKEFEDIYDLYESAERILDREFSDKSAQWAMDAIREWNDNEFDADNTPDDIELEYLPPDKEEWQKVNEMLLEICDMLLTHKIFQVLADPQYIVFLKKFKVITDDMLTSEKWEKYVVIAHALKPIVDDIYNFNKTIYYFITGGIMRLKKCDPENYAAAYYDFINSPNAYKMIANPLSEPFMSYDLTDNLDMNLIPCETAEGSGEYIIAEYYRAKRLQSLLKVDFFKGLMVGHQIRRCLNCDRFFVVSGGYKTKYCDMPSPENPKRTCNQIAFAKKKTKEKNADNPKYQSYQRCIARLTKSCQRKVITESEKQILLHKAEELYHTAMTSPEFTNEEFEQQLSSTNLYNLCGIAPPKKGRPNKENDE